MTNNNQNNAVGHCGLCSGINGRAQFAFGKNRAAEKDSASKKNKGIIGRFLDRLTKANEREFGGSGPCCH